MSSSNCINHRLVYPRQWHIQMEIDITNSMISLSDNINATLSWDSVMTLSFWSVGSSLSIIFMVCWIESVDPVADLCLRPRLYGEKLSRVEGSPAYLSYPGRANFSYISLQNLANRLHEKQKVGSARRVTHLAGSPFCDGRVTLLAGPTFLH